jgi:hypothetical protein
MLVYEALISDDRGCDPGRLAGRGDNEHAVRLVENRDDQGAHPGEEPVRAALAALDPGGPKYEVVVGHVGTVYSGRDGDEARHAFDHYKMLSEMNSGAGGEPVALLEDGGVSEGHRL